MKWSDFISFAGDAGRIPCLTPSTTSFSFLVFIAFWEEIQTFSCLIFILTHVVYLGNEELEYEIRSGQSIVTRYALQSVYRIYLQRAVVYFVWLSVIFWITLLLIHQDLLPHFSLKVISFQGLLVVLIAFLIFLGYYLVMIRLTIRFQRISVLVDFLNTVLLFYSGLVFPVVSFGNLKKLFDWLIRN